MGYSWRSYHQKKIVSIPDFRNQQQNHLSLTDNGVLRKSVGFKLIVPKLHVKNRTNLMVWPQWNWNHLARYTLHKANKLSHLGDLSFLENSRQACIFQLSSEELGPWSCCMKIQNILWPPEDLWFTTQFVMAFIHTNSVIKQWRMVHDSLVQYGPMQQFLPLALLRSSWLHHLDRAKTKKVD